MKTAVFFVPLGLLLGTANYVVDPGHIFHRGAYEQGIVRLLLDGHDVANLSNYDERLLQQYYIEGSQRPITIGVFGSSRSMQVSREMFPGQTFQNYSVSGAVLEDDLALYELLREKERLPRMLILALDPWILNVHHGQSRWTTLQRFYEAAARRLGLLRNRARVSDAAGYSLQRIAELFSPRYFQRTLAALWNRQEHGAYYPTTQAEDEREIKRSDGSLVYDRQTRVRTPAEVHTIALNYVQEGQVYSLERFHQINTTALQQLRALVEGLQKDGVRPVILLPPYHPVTYQRFQQSSRYRIVETVETVLREWAVSEGIQVVGSYDPSRCGCSEEAFLDGMHPKPSCLRKIIGESADWGQRGPKASRRHTE